MKKYYKFFIVLLLVCFIVPQIALASWWNPFSWNIWNNIFHKTDTKTQVLENRVKEPENKPSTQLDTTKEVIKPVEKEVIKKQDINNKQTTNNKTTGKYVEENFRNQTFLLYRDSIEFLRQKISMLEVFKSITDTFNDEDREDLSFFKQIKNLYGYEAANAIQITELKLAESTKIMNARQNLIDDVYKIKLRLESDLSILNSTNSVITKAEFLLRKDVVNALASEAEIDKAFEKINDSVYFTGAKRDEINARLLSVAESNKAQADQGLATLRAQSEAMLKAIPAVVYVPKVVPTQPTSFSCRSTHENWNYTTICSSGFSGKTMTCRSTHENWNYTTNCSESSF